MNASPMPKDLEALSEPGDVIDQSPYRFEVTRMLLRNMALVDIVAELRATFGFEVSVKELFAFQGKHFEKYKPMVDRLVQQERAELTNIVASSEHFSLLSQLQTVLTETDARIRQIKEYTAARPNASMEQALIKLYQLKKEVALNIAEILEETGLEHRLREILTQIARLVMEIFFPEITDPEVQRKLFERFSTEVDKLMENV